jgi:hypothetical protein
VWVDLARSLASGRQFGRFPASGNRSRCAHLSYVAEVLAGAASSLAWGHGSRIAEAKRVTEHKLIGVRHLRCDGRSIPVLLFRNSAGSVAARCLIDPGDTPILDGPSPEAVLSLVAGVIDDLLLARSGNVVPAT